MSQTTKDERKEYYKIWYQKNKEEINRKHREYYEKTKEKKQKYVDDNKEKISNRQKEYNQTPNGKKSQIIGNWKRRGIKSDNYDTLYNNYLSETHCDLCRVKFGKRGDGSGTWKCCDHNHETGLFRNFICNKCNIGRR